jgi:putative transposase
MNRSTNPCKRHRLPPAIIQHAVWLYHRFNLSHRDIEDLLAERGIEATYQSVRLWCNKFSPLFSRRLKRRHPGRRHVLHGRGFRHDRYANNRAELSHQPTRARERGMRRFSSLEQAQRFLSAHAVVYNPFNLQRHLASAAFYRLHRARAFERWNEAVAA